MMDTTPSEMQASYGSSNSKYERLSDKKLQKGDTIIISGYGCALRVKNDALVIFPGKTHNYQTQGTTLLYRGVHTIKHIILLSDKGVVSLAAIKWACEQGVAIMMLDGHGNLMIALSPENEDDASLRRRQYGARDTGLDVLIAREIVKIKTKEQIAVLKALPSHPLGEGRTTIISGQKVILKAKGEVAYGDLIWKRLEDGLAELSRMREISDMRILEGRMAMAYWGLFVGIPINWKSSDRKKVPPHWHRVTERLSPLSDNRTAQHAMNPFHAALNYAYAILQGQCMQSLTSQGFDTTCGFLHADQLHRDSLVFDLMECHRPQVDFLVLHLFALHTLSKGEFMHTHDGSVQFNPQFARFIASSCRIPQHDIDASASWIKEFLVGS